MSEAQSIVAAIYTGWETYQVGLIKAIALLTDVQLGLRTAPNLRSIEEIVTHMIGARARWFSMDETADLAEFAPWDHPDMPLRTAAELVAGLETTWRKMQEAVARWTPADWEWSSPGEEPGDPPAITRQWIIWHLIEH